MMQSSALAAEGAVKGLPEILGVPVQRKDAFLFSPRPLPAALCPSAALLLLSFLPRVRQRYCMGEPGGAPTGRSARPCVRTGLRAVPPLLPCVATRGPDPPLVSPYAHP